MTVIKFKESNPIEAHIAQLKTWQRGLPSITIIY